MRNSSVPSDPRISRRALLLGASGALLAGCAATILRTPREEVAQFPLVDAHSHLLPLRQSPQRGWGREDLIAAMDASGFRRMVVVGYGREVADLARLQPDRFVASYCGELSLRWRHVRGWIKDGTAPDEVERIGAEFETALRSGLYRCIGELHTFTSGIPAAVGGGVEFPPLTIAPDSPLVLRLLEVAGRAGVPANVHCEEPGARHMANALRASRKTTVIWAHVGTPLSPSDLRDILRDHPNVYFDMSAKNPACCPGPANVHYPFLGIGSVLDDTWRQLFEAHPDRFLAGIDFFARAHLSQAREAGEFYRAILTQLTPATARKIGYETAERLYGLR